MLELSDVSSGYGRVRVLHGVSFVLRPGEVVGLLGRNGAGKTTLMRTIMGLVRASEGRVTLGGTDLTRLPAYAVPRAGIAWVPQGRGLFRDCTVAENLRMGLLVRPSGEAVRERALELFPVLRERLGQRAGTLSGGQQQMLATARALCTEPRVLLLDEPGEGLMPSLVERVLEVVLTLREQRVAVLLVEQKVDAVLRVADRVLFLENGALRHESTPALLEADPAPLVQYVGVRRQAGG